MTGTLHLSKNVYKIITKAKKFFLEVVFTKEKERVFHIYIFSWPHKT